MTPLTEYLRTRLLQDLQGALEEEQRARDEAREQYASAERRCNAMHGELEESRQLLEQSDRARRAGEAELSEMHEQVNELSANTASLSVAKRKLEGEMQALQVCSRLLNVIALSYVSFTDNLPVFRLIWTRC